MPVCASISLGFVELRWVISTSSAGNSTKLDAAGYRPRKLVLAGSLNCKTTVPKAVVRQSSARI